MSSYQLDLPPELHSTAQSSESAKKDLLEQCEALWTEIGQCQNKVTGLDDEKLPETDVQLYLQMLKVKALTSEYEQWQNKKPEIISQNQDVLLAAGKEELEIVDRGLEMMLSSVRDKNMKLKSDLEKQQKWLDEQQEAEEVLSAKLEEFRTRSAKVSESSLYQELKTKLQKVRDYRQELLSALGDFLSEYFPVPDDQENRLKKKKSPFDQSQMKWVPLAEILETLISKLSESPHDPYIPVKDDYWPPYLEMLIRYGIALRHPEDSGRIRLEAFHL
ncbi:centromere protein K isoform X2 [Hyperolius riggenbachi]